MMRVAFGPPLMGRLEWRQRAAGQYVVVDQHLRGFFRQGLVEDAGG